MSGGESTGLYRRFVEAGCQVGIAANDLYVLETPEAEAVLASLPRPAGVWRFTSSDTGKRWIGIPDAVHRRRQDPLAR